MEIGLLLIRLVVGFTMAGHGAQKLFGWFGGGGIAGTGAFFESLDFRPGRVTAALVGACELGGGLLLALGFLTSFGALLILAVVWTALAVVHWKNGFFTTKNGIELTLLLGTVSLGLAFTGPGAVSLDAALGLRIAGPDWGVAVFLAGLVAVSAALLARGRFPVRARA